MDSSKILLLLALLIVAFFFNGILKIVLLICLTVLLMVQVFPSLLTFHQKEKMSEQSEEEDNEEQEWFDDLAKELNLVNQKLGYPNDDQFSVLMSLFHLRCCVIAQLYKCIRNCQSNTKEEHWIKNFLNDYVSCPIDKYGIGEFDKTFLEDLKQKAEQVFNTDYNKGFSAPTESYQDEVQRILLSLYYWEFSPSKIIKILDGISSFGFFDEILSKLIHEYMEIDRLTRSGNFETIFMQKCFNTLGDKKTNLWQKTDIDKAAEALERSNKIWDQIFSLFKISIIQRNIKVKNLSEEDLLQQLSSLKYMEKHIDWAILQAGKESNSLGGGLPYPETEKSFFAKAESNPFVNNYSWSV